MSSSLTPLGVALTAGATAGLLLGARMVKTYDWRTQWSIPAPLPLVYEAMTSRSAVRMWWPAMELVDGGGDRLRVGSTVSFRVD